MAQSPGTFTATGDMTAGRVFQSATLLNDGRVLLTGGLVIVNRDRFSLASDELYDPSTRSFTASGNMMVGCNRHTATLLPNGRVLISLAKLPDSRF